LADEFRAIVAKVLRHEVDGSRGSEKAEIGESVDARGRLHARSEGWVELRDDGSELFVLPVGCCRDDVKANGVRLKGKWRMVAKRWDAGADAMAGDGDGIVAGLIEAHPFIEVERKKEWGRGEHVGAGADSAHGGLAEDEVSSEGIGPAVCGLYVKVLVDHSSTAVVGGGADLEVAAVGASEAEFEWNSCSDA